MISRVVIECEGRDVDQGGPWGYRHQINMADTGYGARGPRVYNDRAGEVGRTLDASHFDFDRIFGREGARLVHLSGLVAALSEGTSAFCLDVARAAKRHGSRISFDLNHRASFWAGREDELHRVFHEIASLSDVLVGNEEDFQLCLGIEGPEAGGRDLAAKIESFKGMIDRARVAYPDCTVFATTLREVISANAHLWGAIAAVGDDGGSSLVRSACSTASAAATASSAACSTRSCAAGSRRNGSSSAGRPALWS
jgi:2-dehydro-3-deoxygluconokinase